MASITYDKTTPYDEALLLLTSPVSLHEPVDVMASLKVILGQLKYRHCIKTYQMFKGRLAPIAKDKLTL